MRNINFDTTVIWVITITVHCNQEVLEVNTTSGDPNGLHTTLRPSYRKSNFNMNINLIHVSDRSDLSGQNEVKSMHMVLVSCLEAICHLRWERLVSWCSFYPVGDLFPSQGKIILNLLQHWWGWSKYSCQGKCVNVRSIFVNDGRMR